MNLFRAITGKSPDRRARCRVIAVSMLALSTSYWAGGARAQVDFLAPRAVAVGNDPFAIAAGDFNRDGRLDLVAANAAADTVSVLRGDGNGTFQAAAHYAVGNNPLSVAVGDLDRDNRPDVAVANFDALSVSVLLARSDGTFQAAAHFPVAGAPRAVAVGDFDRDGRADLAVANVSDRAVSVLTGRGDGTFGAAVDCTVGNIPYAVAVADFNGDNRPDLATANADSDSLSVLLGNGDGSFQGARSIFPVGDGPISLAAGDFSGDGRPDLAAASRDARIVSLVIGRGDGSFQAASNFPLAFFPAAVAAGDFNRDGQLDAATANRGGDNVSVVINNGDGTLRAPVNFPAGDGAIALVVGDLNADGQGDVATANVGADTVSVLLGDRLAMLRAAPLAAFAFEVAGPLAVGTTIGSGAGGRRDLLVASRVNNALGLAAGNGDGSFGAPQYFSVAGGPGPFAVADFDADGREDDVAVARLDAGKVGVLLRNADGYFQASDLTVAGLRTVSAGDLDGDGKPDLVALGVDGGPGEVAIWLGHGDGSFSPQGSVSMGQDSVALALADVDGDGDLDLLVANHGSGNVSVTLGVGDGTFRESETFTAGAGPRALAASRFDDDQITDLVVANFPGGADGLLLSSLVLLLGRGDGSFDDPLSIAQGIGPRSLTVGDFDRDGHQDVAASNQLYETLAVLPGRGDGTFHEAAHFASGKGPGATAWDDFDSDGQRDLAVASQTDGAVSVLLNTSDLLGQRGNRLPIAQCRDVTTPTDPGRCAATLSIDDGSFDFDAGDVLSLRQEPPAPYGVGTTLATLTVTDSHGAASACTGLITVQYVFAGFFSPVDDPPTINTVKAGQAVPVKFSLGCEFGLGILAAGSPSSQRIACSAGASLDTIEETVSVGASGLSYDPQSGQYVYAWKTNKAWAGQCRRLSVNLNDGTTRTALFQLR